jgi:hypothetical protein
MSQDEKKSAFLPRQKAANTDIAIWRSPLASGTRAKLFCFHHIIFEK